MVCQAVAVMRRATKQAAHLSPLLLGGQLRDGGCLAIQGVAFPAQLCSIQLVLLLQLGRCLGLHSPGTAQAGDPKA